MERSYINIDSINITRIIEYIEQLYANKFEKWTNSLKDKPIHSVMIKAGQTWAWEVWSEDIGKEELMLASWVGVFIVGIDRGGMRLEK